MINGFEDFQKLNKDGIDLTVKSFGTLTKGLQSIAVELSDNTKKNFEASTSAFEKVVSAKSLDKAFEAQTDFVRTAYEGYVGQISKLGELFTDVTKDVCQPIETAVNKAAK